MPKLTQELKILLSPDDDQRLRKLAAHLKMSMGEVLRQCIEYRYEMQLMAQPRCANGHMCMVAGMHLVQAKKATTVTNPTEEEIPRLVGPPVEAAVL